MPDRAQSSKCRYSYELNSANIKFVDNIDVSCPPPLLFYFSTRYYWREIEPAACRIFDLGVSLKGYLSTDKRGLRFLSITRKRGCTEKAARGIYGEKLVGEEGKETRRRYLWIERYRTRGGRWRALSVW